MIRIFIVGSIVLMLASCRGAKKIQTAVATKDTTAHVDTLKVVTVEDSAAFIRENYAGLIHNRINYTTFSAKIDIDYQDGEGKKYNVTSHVRMYKDSAIWVSINAILGIEVIRALITRDSVKLIDKQNKVYTARSVSYLQDVIALPLDLNSLQNLLIGNPVFLDSNIISYSKDAGTISLLSSDDFFKNLTTISSTSRQLLSTKLDDLDDMRNRTCYLTYTDYESDDGVNFPTKRSISVAEKKKLDIKLNFKQIKFNETLSFPFSAPKNYKRN